MTLISGRAVEKIKGYKWPGVIVAAFHTLRGERRFVVECTVPEVLGALHIYAPEQIRAVDLRQQSTAEELRELAKRLEDVARESPAYSIAFAIVLNASSHLRAVARVHELNQEEARK